MNAVVFNGVEQNLISDRHFADEVVREFLMVFKDINGNDISGAEGLQAIERYVAKFVKDVINVVVLKVNIGGIVLIRDLIERALQLDILLGSTDHEDK